MHYRERPGASPDGYCRRFDTDTWAAVPFECPGYEPADPAIRARSARQAKVEAVLRAHPEQQRAFDVADTPPQAEPGEPISVMVAIRHGEQILSGEVLVPRENRNVAAFVALMEAPEQPQ
jgi:hypothetical protein